MELYFGHPTEQDPQCTDSIQTTGYASFLPGCHWLGTLLCQGTAELPITPPAGDRAHTPTTEDPGESQSQLVAEQRLVEGTQFGSLNWTVITKDASLIGWGAHTMFHGPGPRSREESQPHKLELKAIWLALLSFTDRIRGLQVLIKTDNTTAKTYINKQGRDFRSNALHKEAIVLFL